MSTTNTSNPAAPSTGPKKPMTESEKLDKIMKTTRNIEILHGIGVAVIVFGFFGIVHFADLLNKLKHKQ